MSKNILSTTPKERLERRQKLSYSNAAGLNPSYAVENKWICYIPFKTILGDAYPNLELQCKQFYLPSIEVGISQVSFRGYQIKVPGSRIMNHGDKTIKFQYIVDDDWRNYSMLHTWASRFADYGYSVNRDNDNAELSKLAEYFATIRLWLLDPFKKRIVDFVFHDCWVQSFDDILLDCSSDKHVNHSFTLSYSQFKIEDVLSTKGNLAANKEDFEDNDE